MTSYHDLEDSTYRAVVGEVVTRIHGTPSWRAKERLKDELTKIAMKHKVSYGWSGGKGLIALIIGATRLAADHPTLPAFTFPPRPDMAPNIPNNATAHQIRHLSDQNNLAKRDYAVVTGFCRGASELIRNALDVEYYEDLEHARYGYDEVKPREYIEHLEDEHCPLDEQAKKSARKHYFRGWERTREPRPEGLNKFGKRLDEEQEALDRDGIVVSDADKAEHYLVQVYESGVFPAATIRDWKKKPVADQMHANAKTFFEAEQKGLTEVHRLTGDTTHGRGYESAAAALEQGLDTILERFNTNVERRIEEAVSAGIQQLANAKPPPEQANATSERSITKLREQLADLTATVGTLQKEFSAFATAYKKSGNSNNDSGTNHTNSTGLDKLAGGLQWTDGLELDSSWTNKQRRWWWTTIKQKEPERYKAKMKAQYEKKLRELE